MFRKLLNATTKIFDLPAWIQTISSTGHDTAHTPRVVAVLLIMGGLLHMRSLEQLEGWVRRGRFRRFGAGPISADTIRRVVSHIPVEVWHDWVHRVGRKLARNRAWDTVGGLRVVAIDGVELFVQHSVTCRDCLHRQVQGMTEWFHRIVVASTVGPQRQAVLEWERVHPADGRDKNEGEPTAAYRLLDSLFHAYHHQIEVIVADALYATRVFIEAVRAHGWDVVIRLKDDRLTILKDAQGLLKITDPAVTEPGLSIWDFGELSWGTLTHLRVVYWERTVLTKKRGPHSGTQTSTTVFKGWALTTCGHAVSAYTVYAIMHHRWDLENCIFRQGKTTWRLDHCFGHTPEMIEAMVGVQLAALTLWIWWTTRKTVSPAYKQMARTTWLEIAREALGTMRTDWASRWRLQPT